MWNTKVKYLTSGQLAILLKLEPASSGEDLAVFEGDPVALARRVGSVLGFPKSDKSALSRILSEAKDADTKHVFTWKEKE